MRLFVRSTCGALLGQARWARADQTQRAETRRIAERSPSVYCLVATSVSPWHDGSRGCCRSPGTGSRIRWRSLTSAQLRRPLIHPHRQRRVNRQPLSRSVALIWFGGSCAWPRSDGLVGVSRWSAFRRGARQRAPFRPARSRAPAPWRASRCRGGRLIQTCARPCRDRGRPGRRPGPCLFAAPRAPPKPHRASDSTASARVAP